MLKVEESESRGFLQQIKRNVEGGDWKVRWCVLKGSKVYMYRRQTDDNHTQLIELAGGATELEPFEVYGRDTFRVRGRLFREGACRRRSDRWRAPLVL